MEGFEPSSKQGNHTLSTRLFQPSVFELQQDLDHPLQPYPLIFIIVSRHTKTIPDYSYTARPESFGARASERCLVLSPSDWIKPVYHTSTRQRERNYFRQINF